jgi:hydrophobe/amphiphile efflux-1 (HAE1) family protein
VPTGVSFAISCFNSLTLSPALAAMILRRHSAVRDDHRSTRRLEAVWTLAERAGARFNQGFQRLSDAYGRLVRRLISLTPAMLGLYGVLIAATGYLLITTPKGFIPALDRGYIVVITQLPGGASLDRTTQIARQVADIALGVPGVARVPTFSGFSGATQTLSSNAAGVFVVLKPFPERIKAGQTGPKIAEEIRKRVASIAGASILVVAPPSVEGIGNTGGFAMRLEDRDGLGTAALAKATTDLVAAANKTPGMTGVYTTFSATTPQIKVDLDRDRAEMLGVPAQRINETIETYFGSTYVNDFNILGRTYRVTAQADLPYRTNSEDLARLKTPNNDGNMVPIGSVTRLSDVLGADRVPRYNLYPATEISGDVLPGKSSGFAVATMEDLARKILPAGIAFEWTDLTYQQTTAGNTGLLIFPLCVIFVYLVLAAQYGSWSLPLSILLIVPMCLLAATVGLRVMGQDMNILTQIGFIVLVGLAAKNAILIVEFARQLEREGQERIEAVVEACRLRLRPILMTSLAFILGVLPLVTSEGAGAEMRKSVGTSVFFGMIGVTVFGLLFTPVFYNVVRRLSVRKPDPNHVPAVPSTEVVA